MHGTEQVELWRVDDATRGVEHDFVRRIGARDLAKDNRLVRPERQRGEQAAFECDRARSNAWRLDRGEGAVSSPARSNSFTPGGASMQVMFIASAIDRGTRFTTNSRVAKILSAVSFKRPSGCGSTAIMMTGGS